jgi:hypothetical protein
MNLEQKEVLHRALQNPQEPIHFRTICALLLAIEDEPNMIRTRITERVAVILAHNNIPDMIPKGGII